eukprot:1080450-Rhodomonas_salina.1
MEGRREKRGGVKQDGGRDVADSEARHQHSSTVFNVPGTSASVALISSVEVMISLAEGRPAGGPASSCEPRCHWHTRCASGAQDCSVRSITLMTHLCFKFWSNLCSDCGHSFKFHLIPARGHASDDLLVPQQLSEELASGSTQAARLRGCSGGVRSESELTEASSGP